MGSKVVNQPDNARHSGALGRKTSSVGAVGKPACRQVRNGVARPSSDTSFFKGGRISKDELSELIEISLKLS